ncbi:hypothetical protein B0H10DRAFT_2209403 [Mycena sp. CBHHK59/15]|nr:hypothetical protein B0H10DRAFT_2209403 [Mycena sp. CBHHK59/15]
MATTLPNAGIVPSIPNSFDFDGWMVPPPSKNPTGRTLRIRNRHNLAAEMANEVSIDQTLNCRDERAKYPDVGPPLICFYAYTAEDMVDMIYSELYCSDVGPLPASIRGELERARKKKSERTEADKSEKTKGCRIKGSMILSNPVTRWPGQRLSVVIPQVVLLSILHKLYVPLHWFLDKRLDILQHRLHDVSTKLLLPEPSPEFLKPDKVLVFDMLKLTQDADWGSDEHSSCMSPLQWQQCMLNMEVALTTLSEEVPDVAGTPPKLTCVAQFRQHRLFFLNYEKFEEHFLDWCTFERKARHEILRGLLFDADYYARQVDALICAKQAVGIYILSADSRKQQRLPNFLVLSRGFTSPSRGQLFLSKQL